MGYLTQRLKQVTNGVLNQANSNVLKKPCLLKGFFFPIPSLVSSSSKLKMGWTRGTLLFTFGSKGVGGLLGQFINQGWSVSQFSQQILFLILNWFPTPFFWGIGLLFHYIKVFGLPGTGGLYTEDWERRIFDEELDQIKKEEEEIEEMELRQMKKEKPNTWDDSELV